MVTICKNDENNRQLTILSIGTVSSGSLNVFFFENDINVFVIRFFFVSNTFISNASLKLAKNQGNA